MRDIIRKILLEEVSQYEYQVRDIGGDTYYKKRKGDKYWEFTTKNDFDENATDKNTVKWVEKKPPKPPYVRQVDVPTTMKGKDGKIKYLKDSYSSFHVKSSKLMEKFLNLCTKSQTSTPDNKNVICVSL